MSISSETKSTSDEDLRKLLEHVDLALTKNKKPGNAAPEVKEEAKQRMEALSDRGAVSDDFEECNKQPLKAFLDHGKFDIDAYFEQHERENQGDPNTISMWVNYTENDQDMATNPDDIEQLPEPQLWMERISSMDVSSKLPKTDLKGMLRSARESSRKSKPTQKHRSDSGMFRGAAVLLGLFGVLVITTRKF